MRRKERKLSKKLCSTATEDIDGAPGPLQPRGPCWSCSANHMSSFQPSPARNGTGHFRRWYKFQCTFFYQTVARLSHDIPRDRSFQSLDRRDHFRLVHSVKVRLTSPSMRLPLANGLVRPGLPCQRLSALRLALAGRGSSESAVGLITREKTARRSNLGLCETQRRGFHEHRAKLADINGTPSKTGKGSPEQFQDFKKYCMSSSSAVGPE